MLTLERLQEEKKQINIKIREAKKIRRQKEGTWISNMLIALRNAIYLRIKPQSRDESMSDEVEASLNTTLDKIEKLIDKTVEEQCSQRA